MKPIIIKDASWIRQSFLVSRDSLDKVHFQNRIFSTASIKYTDTTPGGNFAINPPPQYTSTCDIKAETIYAHGIGMGRYYSEAIDDNSQVISMRFGVAQFNSLTTFFTHFYNPDAGQLARSARAPGILYKVGFAIGFVATMTVLPIILLDLAGLALRFFTGSPSSKFYYLKPAMPMYWGAVNTMVNHIAVNSGIVPRLFGPDKSNYDNTKDGYEFDTTALKKLHDLLPDIFNQGGGIDVYSMAGRAQRLSAKQYKKIEEVLNRDGNQNLSAAIQEVMKDKLVDDKNRSYSEYLQSYLNKPQSRPIPEGKTDAANSTVTQASTNLNATASSPVPSSSTTSTEGIPSTKDEKASFIDFFQNELDDGSAFASFRVNFTGPVSESFSNSVTESDLSNKINSMSSSARNTNFSYAGGNVDDGFIGKLVGGIATGIGDFIRGEAASLHVSGLAVFAGAAFVDIPKHWQSSMASLPRASYTINLRSPYGNPISRLLNLHIPLAMLLAGALPIATGKQSYTSPFLLELYDRGRCQTRLGMIDSLSVTRGVGNLGFDKEGHAMGIDVSFSVIDMSSIMTMPISEGISMDVLSGGALEGGLLGLQAGAGLAGVPGAIIGAGIGATVGNQVKQAVNNIFDDDNTFTDYMAVLSSMNISDQIYSIRKLKLNLTRAMVDWKTWYSPSHFASVAGNTLPARLVSAFYRGTPR